MSPIFVIALLGVGAYALTKKQTPSQSAATKAASEAPVDANSLLATALAPSLVDPTALSDIIKAFIAGAANQTNGDRKLRLAQYALTTFLKLAMIVKGKQPDPNELLMIAYAPTAGGAGLIGYGDIGVDRQAAVASALAETFGDPNALGMYIGAFAQAYNTAKPGLERKRLLAYILATKAKQIALLAGGYKFPAQSYFAIANIAAANLPSTTPPNSIVAY
jgi:hypothetical protein